MYSLDQYCSQNIMTLSKTSNIPIESNCPKIDVLIRSAPIYLQKQMISHDTMKIIMDPRFKRLFKTRSQNLKILLSQHDIIPVKQSKTYIIALCYSSGLDIDNGSDDSISGDNNSSDNNNSSGNTDINDINDMLTDLASVKFYKEKGKIYLGNNVSNIEITNNMLINLFKLLLPSTSPSISPSLSTSSSLVLYPSNNDNTL